MSTIVESEHTPIPAEQRRSDAAALRPAARDLALRFGAVTALVVLDLWSKSAASVWLERLDESNELVPDACAFTHLRYPILGEWLTFMLSLNPGAAWGHFDSWPYLLVGGRIFAGLFLVWLLIKTARGKPWLVTAFVLVLSGALGNLYDNLLRSRDLLMDERYPKSLRPFGPVRDFIDVYFSAWHWHFPTFNVADSCITLGAAVLLLSGLWRDKARA